MAYTCGHTPDTEDVINCMVCRNRVSCKFRYRKKHKILNDERVYACGHTDETVDMTNCRTCCSRILGRIRWEQQSKDREKRRQESLDVKKPYWKKRSPQKRKKRTMREIRIGRIKVQEDWSNDPEND